MVSVKVMHSLCYALLWDNLVLVLGQDLGIILGYSSTSLSIVRLAALTAATRAADRPSMSGGLR
jgi:hypothetical protein